MWLAVATGPVPAATPAAAPLPVVDIPFQKFVLDNGLTLIVHEDHKAPVVAVNIWYHVGSKDERPGRTGFAHLFEHLMFNGSENHRDEWFKPMEAAGATKLNGTTWFDRTNYFQNVPTSAFDMTLWMESDRMGHLLGAIDQKVLDEQRGVVQNEKRQGDNQPYGKADEVITTSTYPAGHPYSWRPSVDGRPQRGVARGREGGSAPVRRGKRECWSSPVTSRQRKQNRKSRNTLATFPRPGAASPAGMDREDDGDAPRRHPAGSRAAGAHLQGGTSLGHGSATTRCSTSPATRWRRQETAGCTSDWCTPTAPRPRCPAPLSGHSRSGHSCRSS